MPREAVGPWPSPAHGPGPAPPGPLPEGETEAMSNAQRSTLKWEKEETLGELATVAPVLYTNVNFPTLKEEYPGNASFILNPARLSVSCQPQCEDTQCVLCEAVGMTTPLLPPTDWPTRVKQIAKLWRKASSQDRAPYVVRPPSHSRTLSASLGLSGCGAGSLACRGPAPLSHLARRLVPMQFEVQPFTDELINIGNPAQC